MNANIDAPATTPPNGKRRRILLLIAVIFIVIGVLWNVRGEAQRNEHTAALPSRTIIQPAE